MRRVGRVLGKAVVNDDALRAGRAQTILRDWPNIVGEELAKRSSPDRYTRGTVWVAVTGSAWAQELRMRKEMILARLRERAEDPNLFLDVRFGVRPLPEPEPVVDEAEAVEETAPEELTIREIARRRLARMRGEVP